jgi:hypothetical protein
MIRKCVSKWTWQGTPRILVHWVEGCLNNSSRILSLCFGSMGKIWGVTSHNILLKRFLSSSALAIIFLQVETRCYLSSALKDCGKKRAHSNLFPKFIFRIQRTTDLRMFKYSAIILDAIRRSFFNKPPTASMCISVRLECGSHPSRHIVPTPFRLETMKIT